EEGDTETTEVAHLAARPEEAREPPVLEPVGELDGFRERFEELGNEPLPPGRALLHEIDAARNEPFLPLLEVGEVLLEPDHAAAEVEDVGRQGAAAEALFDFSDAHGLGRGAQEREDLLVPVPAEAEHAVPIGFVEDEVFLELLGEQLAHRTAELGSGRGDELVDRLEPRGKLEVAHLGEERGAGRVERVLPEEREAHLLVDRDEVIAVGEELFADVLQRGAMLADAVPPRVLFEQLERHAACAGERRAEARVDAGEPALLTAERLERIDLELTHALARDAEHFTEGLELFRLARDAGAARDDEAQERL